MKKALSLLLALLLCASLAVPALAYSPLDYNYSEITVSDLSDSFMETKVTITFEAAVLEKGSFVFSFDGEHFMKKEDANILTVKPGSKVTVNDSVHGDLTKVMGLVMVDGHFEFTGINAPIVLKSGSISDWPLGKSADSAMGKSHTLGLLELWGVTPYYVRLGPDEGETPAEPAPAEPAPAEPAPAPASEPETAELRVMLSPQNLSVNGTEKKAEIYNINDKNYFKLRDVAALLNGTSSQFSVDYDTETKTIAVKTGAPYVPNGTELVLGEDRSSTCVVSGQTLTINGQKVDLTAYNLGGNNFFGLRELGEALNFDVDYDTATRTMIVKSR